MNISSGPIKIEKIKKTDDDLQVTFKYNDFRNGTRRAYLALGQEIMIKKTRDDNIPNRFLVTHCTFSVVTKEYGDKE